jgi:hypothetical protein
LQPEALSVTGDYRPREWARAVHAGLDSKRNGVIVAHRRAGKTVLIVAQLIRDLFRCKLPAPQVAFIAPTASQARKVAWPYFRKMLSHIPGVEFREFSLEIRTPGGGRVIFASGEQYDRLRGLYLDAAAVDEGADCPESLIGQVLRPALADRGGKLYMIGTVKGRGPFWQTFERARSNPADWYSGLFLPHDTDALPAAELELLRREMSDDEYRQEMLCDPDAAVRGAYYGGELRKAQEQGRITSVPYDENLPVTVAFDLGISDSTAVWFAQLHRGGEIRLIDFREWANTAFTQILREIRELPYHYGEFIGPHDLKVREYTSGQSRFDAAAELGVIFTIAPRLPVIDGIEAVRRALGRCWFDGERTKQGRDALQLYRSEWDDKRRVLSRNPVHDWTSHAADSFRYLITATSGGQARSLFESAPIDYDAIIDRQRV